MPKTEYDPAVIQTFADKLYARAKSVVALYSFVGLVIGYLGFNFFAPADPRVTGRYALAATIITAAFGFLAGRARVLRLKLEAQVALCQKRIEENTRKPADPNP